jgi:hypothetical protein
MKVRFWLALSLAFLILFSGGCAADPGVEPSSNRYPGFESQLNSLVQPYSFNLFGWEIATLFNDIKQKVFSPPPESALNSQSVIHYFSYVAQANTLKSGLRMVQAKKIQGDIEQYEAELSKVEEQIQSLKPVVEQTIARQITETLADQGIHHPFGDNWFKLTFPPVNFKLEKPLYILIISPRDKIDRIREITITPDITTAQMEELESSLSRLGISPLVVQIGGLGATYPSFVINNADLRFTIDVAVEEWLHQYLAFKPLGFRYVLDLLRIVNDEHIPTINETVAGIAAREIGAMVYDRYYSQYKPKESENVSSPTVSDFDFNAAMREIRKNVNSYLEAGQVDEAEKYMEDQRQFLITKGYYIRKLNQAYFAFHGSYAYGPTSIDPIGNEIRLLRKHSLSVKDFIDSASRIRTRDDLSSLVSQYQ